MQDLLNGLELVEQTAGPASGMHGKHGSGTGMLISALRHIRTKVPFIANGTSMICSKGGFLKHSLREPFITGTP